MTITLGEAIATHGIQVEDHLDRSFEIPVVSGAQRQGDVIVLKMRPGKVANLKPVPPEGVVVVRAEASGGNTHTLIGGGQFAENTTDRMICGTLVVEKDDSAFLAHPEHGYLGIGEGSYIIRRQVEQSDELRVVQD